MIADDSELSLSTLRRANQLRLEHSKFKQYEDEWAISDWHLAISGELGEFANLWKKIRRGDFTLEEKREDLAKELADVQCYLDILAFKLGIHLGNATIKKFNEVSDRIGSDIVIFNNTPVKM